MNIKGMVNAVMGKDSETDVCDCNSENFELKELSEEANIEIIRNGTMGDSTT